MQPLLGVYRTFTRVWRQLHEEGVCDAPGGAEYERVLLAWQAAGRPGWIAAFIRDQANRPASEGRAG